MKQYGREYMKDPVYLMGISYGLLKALMITGHPDAIDVEAAIYEEIDYYKEEAKRRSKQLGEAAVSTEDQAEQEEG